MCIVPLKKAGKMRVEPAEKIRRAKEIHIALRKVIVRVTHLIAVIIAFVSTFALLIKILFF